MKTQSNACGGGHVLIRGKGLYYLFIYIPHSVHTHTPLHPLIYPNPPTPRSHSINPTYPIPPKKKLSDWLIFEEIEQEAWPIHSPRVQSNLASLLVTHWSCVRKSMHHSDNPIGLGMLYICKPGLPMVSSTPPIYNPPATHPHHPIHPYTPFHPHTYSTSSTNLFQAKHPPIPPNQPHQTHSTKEEIVKLDYFRRSRRRDMAHPGPQSSEQHCIPLGCVKQVPKRLTEVGVEWKELWVT